MRRRQRRARRQDKLVPCRKLFRCTGERRWRPGGEPGIEGGGWPGPGGWKTGPGTVVAKSGNCGAASLARSSPERAVTPCGTSISRSSRRVAVTTISVSSEAAAPASWAAACGVCAAMHMISSNAVDGPVYIITQTPFWQGPYRTFYPQIARIFTRLLFLLLSLLRQPVGEARDGLADQIGRAHV